MTREEAIDIIKCLAWHRRPNEEDIEQAIKTLKQESKWIPVSERLPEEEHEVYCQLSDGSNAVLYVQDNWGQMEWVDGMMGTGTYDVVAWMEKPEPYKADREVSE